MVAGFSVSSHVPFHHRRLGRCRTRTRFLTWLNWFVSNVDLAIASWFIEQRAHDKEYWLIFAHVIPFLLVIYAKRGHPAVCHRDGIQEIDQGCGENAGPRG